MANKRLKMSEEERRLYNNKMHRKQEKVRKEKATRRAIKDIVCEVISVFESLGWEKTELILGADEDMIDAVVDKLIEADKFKITFGKKIGVKIKE